MNLTKKQLCWKLEVWRKIFRNSLTFSGFPRLFQKSDHFPGFPGFPWLLRTLSFCKLQKFPEQLFLWAAFLIYVYEWCLMRPPAILRETGFTIHRKLRKYNSKVTRDHVFMCGKTALKFSYITMLIPNTPFSQERYIFGEKNFLFSSEKLDFLRYASVTESYEQLNFSSWKFRQRSIIPNTYQSVLPT